MVQHESAEDLRLTLGSTCVTMAELARHRVISGVTGSGKTTTAKVIAESLAANGVPIFAI